MAQRGKSPVHQKVQIARALSLDEAENEVWGLILKINALRNQLAHSLEVEQRDAKVRTVMNAYFDLYEGDMEDERDYPDHLIVSFAIALANGFLVTFLGEAKRFRELVKAMDYRVNPHRYADG